MQWKWILWFYTFEARYRSKFDDKATEADGKSEAKAVAAGTWWLPSWRFTALKMLAAVWLMTVAALPWRHGDVHALAGLMIMPFLAVSQSSSMKVNGTSNDSVGEMGREL
jgi:hypothetical protein